MVLEAWSSSPRPSPQQDNNDDEVGMSCNIIRVDQIPAIMSWYVRIGTNESLIHESISMLSLEDACIIFLNSCTASGIRF